MRWYWSSSDMSGYNHGKSPVILIVVHCVWANTWECSCSKGFGILLVVSSTILLKCVSVHLHRFSSVFTASCSHLHLRDHSVRAALLLWCSQVARAQSGKTVLSNGEVELKSLFLSPLLFFLSVSGYLQHWAVWKEKGAKNLISNKWIKHILSSPSLIGFKTLCFFKLQSGASCKVFASMSHALSLLGSL